ncbi:MAG: heat-inducible transcription repressor HrcA [Clostridiaceae bacterium]|nr:heat-inducible transcription repressor HrcA [Clostridiaceae bacterium]
MGLNNRKNQILKAVVDDYIGTAEPVGSKSLVSKYNFNVSPATIRNEMAELEELGYLEQPHTSAGRIPSDKGYRAYVDHLLQVDELPRAEADKIRNYLRDNMDEVTQLIRKAATVLSEKTDYTSLVLSPQYKRSHLKQIKMLMIEPGKALVVVVLSAGVVKDRLVRIPEILDAVQLMQIASAIEDGLSGMTLDDITLVTVAAAARQTPLPESLLNQVMYEAYLSIKQADHLDIYLDGSHRMLAQPEFQDVRKAHDFLETLNRDKLIAGYMSELKESDDLSSIEEEKDENKDETKLQKKSNDPAYMVRIGQEILLDGLQDCSFITTSYKIGDTVAGRIGVIGPRRMEYGKVISHINFVKMTVNDQIIRLANGETRMEEQNK